MRKTIHDFPEDEKAVLLQQKIKDHGLTSVLNEISNLETNGIMIEHIIAQMDMN